MYYVHTSCSFFISSSFFILQRRIQKKAPSFIEKSKYFCGKFNFFSPRGMMWAAKKKHKTFFSEKSISHGILIMNGTIAVYSSVGVKVDGNTTFILLPCFNRITHKIKKMCLSQGISWNMKTVLKATFTIRDGEKAEQKKHFKVSIIIKKLQSILQKCQRFW